MRLRPFSFLIGLLFAASAMAQTAPQAQTERSGESQGSLASGMTINAELKGSIDTKKIKPNDPVVAQTTDKVKSSDGRTILPKGAKLIGHVTQAGARSKGDQQSMVAMQFDKATTKDGQEIPLTNVVIQAIAAPAIGGPVDSRGPGASGGAPAGGGASGTPNNPSMSGSSGGRTGSSTTGSNPANSYPGTSGQSEGGGAADNGPLPPNSQGVYGLQNVRLGHANTSNGQNSIIISNDKNLHLDSGTRLLLMVQPQAQGSTGTPGQ